MTDLITFTVPAVYLNGATSCALYVFSGTAFDVVQFDIVDGQPVLRPVPAALEHLRQKGAAHAQNPD